MNFRYLKKMQRKFYPSSSRLSNSRSSNLHDEIAALDSQKNHLITKKSELERRIDILQRTCLYKPSQAIYSSELDNEYQTLVELIEQQKEEIELLKQTDEAALRQELQEEVKTTYLERCRLQDLQLQQQRDYNDIRDKYEEMTAREGPEATQKMKSKIEHYEELLNKYQHSNHKLKTKIETLRANKAFSDQEGKEKIEQRKIEINEEIEKTRKEISELEKKIEDEKEEHRQKLRDIRLNSTTEK